MFRHLTLLVLLGLVVSACDWKAAGEPAGEPPPAVVEPTLPPASGGGRADNPPSGDLPPGTTFERVRAPIDGAATRWNPQPPGLSVDLVIGLPSGCASQDDYEVNKNAEVITVIVWNKMVTGGVCTQIYGTYRLSIDLGSGFEPGKTYVVRVNDRELTFWMP